MREQASSRHVFIYGSPGAGKLTVARELSRRTGFRLLDNHLTIDVALALFEFGAPGFYELCSQLRLSLFGAAGDAGVDVVSTFAFADPEDREFVQRVTEVVAEHGGTVCFVQLCPERAEIERRIMSGDREQRGKIHELDTFGQVLERYDVFSKINPTDLSIDNTTLAPDVVVDRICEHFGL